MNYRLQIATPTTVSSGLLISLLIAACGGRTISNSETTTSAGGQIASFPGQGGFIGAGGQSVSRATGGMPTISGLGGMANGNSITGGASSTTQTSLPGQIAACQGLPITTNASDAGAQCASVGIELEPNPLDMFMMIDRTQSMTYTVQNTSLERWDVVQQGVQQFVNDPSVLVRLPRVGLGFFGATGNPNDPTECDPNTYATPQIEIESIATSGPKILQAVMDERSFLVGQTPWFPALQGSLMHAQSWQTANPNRRTVVVLITDGYPTECDTDLGDIQEMVSEYYAGIQGTYNTTGQPGIRTYVIGVAVDRFNLDAVAQAGGTGSSTIVDSVGAVDEFVTALVNITNSYVACKFPLPSPPQGELLDPSKLQVIFKPFQGADQEIPMASSAADCGSVNGGWYYDNPTNPTEVTLCPCTCASLGAGGLEIHFGCQPIIGIIN